MAEHRNELILSHEFVRWCGVSRRTARKWVDQGNAPSWAIDLCSLHLGWLAWEGWDGWKITSEGLWSPEGSFYHSGDIRALPYLKELLRERERELAEIQKRFGRVVKGSKLTVIDGGRADSEQAVMG